MCGIAGILSFRPGIVSKEVLKRMTDAIMHRGPDGEGQWIDASARVGLGHRRLSIIDLSAAGAQPMRYMDRYSITFNGEIYNYLELREELERKGVAFVSQTDTEVLLALYHLEGEACLRRLDGMWAFAIWDDLRQELFCARDRFGEKPFHYYKDANAFYFASEMKALWVAGVPKEVGEDAMSAYERARRVHVPARLGDTFYKNIFKLEHSHWMRVHADGRTSITRYYDIDWRKQDFPGTMQEAVEEFRRLFIGSLRYRCRSDVPVGTSLSGGLDSSSIVCNVARWKGQGQVSPHTFSARFEGYKKDEGYFIEKVIERTGVIPHFVRPTGEEMFRDLDTLCYHQEEPFASASIYAQYRVQQLAKEHGISVLIDGQGADELLAGYTYYYPIYLQSMHGLNVPWRTRLKEHRAYQEHDTTGNARKPWVGLTDIRQSMTYLRRGRTISLNEVLHRNFTKGPLQELLRYADRNSMAHGREVRLPFLGHELVEFCFSLPDDRKLQLGWTKYVMRKAFEDVLPPEVAWRRDKLGFEVPEEDWLRRYAPGRTWYRIMREKFDPDHAFKEPKGS
ncbi:MAG: asparagine synthase (glutamine-hydrolyzing) [Flavobacteriales bacterium]|nr:asparagine synthase (glutamine-hydrolyzing) [Flavobacteriales bacterium]